jgi:hypothetical protein
MIQLALSIASRSLAFGIWLLIVLSIIVPVLAQDGNYALNVNTANCVSDPSDPELNPLYGGALSFSLVVEDTVLLSQPPLTADTVPLEIVPVPAGVRVIVFDVDEQTRSYFEQTGNVSNATGATDLSQDISLRRQFRHRIDLRIVEDSGLDQHSVQQHILAAYDLPDQLGEKNCTILSDVPASR